MDFFNKKDVFTIPNILSYIRILLIPIFIYFYLNDTPKDLIISIGIIIFSGLTDLLDGKIARKYNQVTELGKVIDPVADKLSQGALIFCLTLKYKLMWAVVILFVIKESFMAIMGILMLRHNGQKLDGAKWFGKLSTAGLYIIFIILIIYNGPIWVANTLIILCALMLLNAFIGYIRVFYKMWQINPSPKEALLK